MHVSRRQAALALDAVRRRHRRAIGKHRHQVRRRPGVKISPYVLDLVLREVEGQGPVRIDLVREVSARRDADEWPTAEEVADMAVRRAVCDRLR
ncbi:MAG TPA: hypothetical protein VFB94_19760 [Acidimicrobiales bacterium]|nr:hypothetical protein [Acidimicrobiales bacterium]